MTPEQIFEAALALPDGKREELISALQQTLYDPLADPEFLAELDRRSEDAEKYPEKLRSREDVMRDLRKRFG